MTSWARHEMGASVRRRRKKLNLRRLAAVLGGLGFAALAGVAVAYATPQSSRILTNTNVAAAGVVTGFVAPADGAIVKVVVTCPDCVANTDIKIGFGMPVSADQATSATRPVATQFACGDTDSAPSWNQDPTGSTSGFAASCTILNPGAGASSSNNAYKLAVYVKNNAATHRSVFVDAYWNDQGQGVHDSGTQTVSCSSGCAGGSVTVANWPATQTVAGSVNVGNFPGTQTVAGSVNVGNFPGTQTVACASGCSSSGGGTVTVANWPGTQTVSDPATHTALAGPLTVVCSSGCSSSGGSFTGTVTVADGATVNVGNWPVTQTVGLADGQNAVALETGDANRLDLIWIGVFIVGGLALGIYFGQRFWREYKKWGLDG